MANILIAFIATPENPPQRTLWRQRFSVRVDLCSAMHAELYAPALDQAHYQHYDRQNQQQMNKSTHRV